MVFGGSWGTALGLLYTQTHPERVRSIVLRGVTTLRRAELMHSRQGPNGAAKFYPEIYEQFIGLLTEPERLDPIAAYYRRLISGDQAVMDAAAREWNRWDITLTSLKKRSDAYNRLEDSEWSRTHALMAAHYYAHGAWLEEGQLLANIKTMKHIPGMPWLILLSSLDTNCKDLGD